MTPPYEWCRASPGATPPPSEAERGLRRRPRGSDRRRLARKPEVAQDAPLLGAMSGRHKEVTEEVRTVVQSER